MNLEISNLADADDYQDMDDRIHLKGVCSESCNLFNGNGQEGRGLWSQRNDVLQRVSANSMKAQGKRKEERISEEIG